MGAGGAASHVAAAMTMHVDFTSQDYLRDPAAGIARLRRAGPVVEVKFPIVGRTWITTTHELAARVLKDSETFTIRRKGGGPAGLRWWMPGFLRALAENMLATDEPEHTRLRSIVDEAFRRRAVLAMEPRIQAIARGAGRQALCRRQSRRPGGALRAHAAAFRHVRAARFAFGRPGQVHGLGGEHVTPARPDKLPAPDHRPGGDEALPRSSACASPARTAATG